jgi:SAM-dependent methyltransferase
MKTFATAAKPEPSSSLPCAVCGSLNFLPLWKLEGFSFVRCPACGLIQQNPQPLESSVLGRYGDAYLAYEIERQFEFRELELKALRDLRFDARVQPILDAAKAEGRAASILDVGCATGALLERFKSEGWRCVGVEPCAGSAEYGKREYGLDIRSCTLAEAHFADASFDVVHASQLVEHLNDPAAFLREVGRILAPGGILVLATPNADGFQARVLGPAWRSAINDHLYLFSRRTIRALLAASGFSVDALRTWGGWAKGLEPSWIKPALDRAAKALGQGDVMALMASPRGGPRQ